MYFRSREMDNNTSTASISYNFVNRVVGLPVVKSLLDTATQTYGKAKDGNVFLKYTLDTAEQTVSIAMGYAMPVVNKLETPMVLADSLACKTLDKIEETVPIVKKTPDEIVNDAKNIYVTVIVDPASRAYNSVKEYSMQKISAAKEKGREKAIQLLETEYGVKATVAVDKLLSQADGLIESYLPNPQEGEQRAEEPVSTNADSNTLDKALFVSNKLNKRMLAVGTFKVQATKKRVDDILATLNAVDVMSVARSNFEQTNMLLKEQFSQAQLRAIDLMNVYNPREMIGKTWDQIINNPVVPHFKVYYDKLPSVALLKEQVHPALLTVSSNVMALTKPYLEAKSWADVSGAVVVQVNDGVNQLKGVCFYVLDGVRNSKVFVGLAFSDQARRGSADRGSEVMLGNSETGLRNSGNDKATSSSEEDSVELVVKQH